MRLPIVLKAFFPYSHVAYLGNLPPSHLQYIISQMVAKNLAVYEPAKQTRSVLLHWRLPEEWAELLHEWVCIDNQYLKSYG